MGFNKIKRALEEAHEAISGKKSEQPKSYGGFVPSTKEDLKRYEKLGKKRVENKKSKRDEGKASSKQKRLIGGQNRSEKYREMIQRHEKFDVLVTQTFDRFEEIVKENGMKVPRYREYLPRKEADAQFLYEVNCCLAKMTWAQLSKLVSVAVNCPVVTREFSEAYHYASHILVTLCLGAVYSKDKVNLKMADLSVLDEWPAETLKRPTKEDRMSKKAKPALESEKEELELEEEEEDTEDEDTDDEESDDEGDDEESEDEDSEDEDSEDEDSEDEDSEDEDSEDEEDEPAPKRRKEKAVKTEKKGKKGKEDDAPVKTKKKAGTKESSVVSKSKKGKETAEGKKGKKAEKPEKAEKERRGPREKRSKVEISWNSSKFARSSKPREEKAGAKGRFYALLSKKPHSLKELEALAKENDLPVGRVKSWLEMMAKGGYVTVT